MIFDVKVFDPIHVQVSVSSAVGSVTVVEGTGITVSATGVSGTGAVGSVTVVEGTGITVNTTGVSSTGAVGSVTVNFDFVHFLTLIYQHMV